MVAAIETLFAKPRKTRRPVLDEQIQSLRVLLEKADHEFFDECAREYRRTREAVMIGYVYYPNWLWPQLEDAEGDVVEAGWGYGKENVLRRLRGEPVRIFAPGPADIPPEARSVIAVAENATVYPREAIDRYTATRIPPLKYQTQIRRRLLARDIVTEGIGRGEGVRGISNALESDGFGRSAWHREVIARTETAVLFEHGKMSEYVASPSVNGFRFDAVIDNRTTVTCEYMDGREFRVEDANGVEPPLHFACRSTTEPIFIFDAQPDWQRADAVLDGASAKEKPLPGFGGVDYSIMPPQGTPADLYRALNASESAVAKQYAAELEARAMQIREGRVPAVIELPEKAVPRFSTTAEAQEWLEDHTLITCNFADEGMPLETAQSIVDSTAQMVGRYPVLSEKRGTMWAWEFTGDDVGVWARASGKDWNEIDLSSVAFTGSPSKLRKDIQRAMDIGFHVANGANAGHLVTHELGHTIEGALRARHPEHWKSIRDWASFSSGEATQISEYAAANASEMFAEAIAMIEFSPRSTWTEAVEVLESILLNRGILVP